MGAIRPNRWSLLDGVERAVLSKTPPVAQHGHAAIQQQSEYQSISCFRLGSAAGYARRVRERRHKVGPPRTLSVAFDHAAGDPCPGIAFSAAVILGKFVDHDGRAVGVKY